MTVTEDATITLLKRFDPGDVAGGAELLAEDFGWHFFNSRLPDVLGDYVGVAGRIAELWDILVRLCSTRVDGTVMRQPES